MMNQFSKLHWFAVHTEICYSIVLWCLLAVSFWLKRSLVLSWLNFPRGNRGLVTAFAKISEKVRFILNDGFTQNDCIVSWTVSWTISFSKNGHTYAHTHVRAHTHPHRHIFCKFSELHVSSIFHGPRFFCAQAADSPSERAAHGHRAGGRRRLVAYLHSWAAAQRPGLFLDGGYLIFLFA